MATPSVTDSEFGRKQLLKYGWKEGKGLGRNEDGISKPIKASMKFDKTGIGHDASEEYTFQWWDHVFNSAANSIVVENSKKGVEVTKVNEVEIRTRKPLEAKLKKKKKMCYGVFVKSGTLVNDRKDGTDDCVDEVNDHVPQSSENVRLSDEEILKRCGGLTGHKAARHGHRLSGKLKRLQEQESGSLLTNGKKRLECDDMVLENEEPIVKKKKKKKRRNEQD